MHVFRAIAAALGLLAISTVALAEGAAIRAVTSCVKQASCGEDIRLDEAKANYETEGKARLAKYRERAHAKRDVTPPPNEDPFARQLRGMMEKFLADLDRLPPRPVLDRHVCEREMTLGPYFWAPASEFPDGSAEVEHLLERVRSGTAENGGVLVEAAESLGDEKHYALCDVVTVGNASGPPRDCVTVAIVTPSEKWVRAGFEFGGCPAMATFRASGAIDISFDVYSTMSVEAVGNSVLRTLQKSFGLSVSRRIGTAEDGSVHHVRLIGAGALRDSAILEDWREAIDFDVTIESAKGVPIEVRGIAHAMVSRRAAGNLPDYRGLNDAQRSKYSSAFDHGIETSIMTAGTNCTKQDALRILCN